VNPSVSEVADVASFSVPGASASLPEVDRRDLDTVVRIQSGETLVLAGIIKTSDSVDNRGVPWLDRLPILGALFRKEEKSKTRTELAIFITPTLMEDASEIETQRKDSDQRLKDTQTDPNPPGKYKLPITEP
jgi:general secretion pathway protein D